MTKQQEHNDWDRAGVDPALAAQLNSYRMPDADEALLARIMAAAQHVPQVPRRHLGISARRWGAQTAMLACLALGGYWSGTAVSWVERDVILEQRVSTNDVYLEKVLFGVQSWKEIDL